MGADFTIADAVTRTRVRLPNGRLGRLVAVPAPPKACLPARTHTFEDRDRASGPRVCVVCGARVRRSKGARARVQLDGGRYTSIDPALLERVEGPHERSNEP